MVIGWFAIIVGVLALIFRTPHARLMIFTGRRFRFAAGQRTLEAQVRWNTRAALVGIGLGVTLVICAGFGCSPLGVW